MERVTMESLGVGTRPFLIVAVSLLALMTAGWSRVTAQAETTHAHSSYAQETPSWAEQLKGQTVVEDAIEGHPERTAMVERQHHRIMQQMEKDAEA